MEVDQLKGAQKMRLTLAVIFVMMFFSVPTVAEDANAPRTDEDTSNQQLLERIEELEKRVAALESRLASPYAPPQPYRPGKPYPHVTPAPSYPPYSPPRAPQHSPYSPNPPRGYIEPKVQPDERVPDSWQRFEFNGQYFYIIPVDEFENTTRERR
jgi:hypothetical protein